MNCMLFSSAGFRFFERLDSFEEPGSKNGACGSRKCQCGPLVRASRFYCFQEIWNIRLNLDETWKLQKRSGKTQGTKSETSGVES